MRNNTLRILAVAALSLSVCSTVQALDRYVVPGGTGKGTSWSDAYGKVQDAINAVAGEGGNVFVKAGTYTPTSTTGENGVLYSAFQIPSGVKVYGGFVGNETGANAAEIIAKRATTDTRIGKQMVNKTIFSGNLNGNPAEFIWNDTKHRFTTTYYGSAYHVVVFTPSVGSKPNTSASVSLDAEALLDGVVITGGHASNGSIEDDADHTAYGGGVWMIGNSVLQNSEIYNCEASRDGGGVYMVGGTVQNCYIHDCQAMGVNTVTGLGGGIALKEAGFVSHSAILNNASRMGGGVSFSLTTTGTGKTGDAYAQMALSASLVAQNVAIIEGGGVYMNCGGVINGTTVVRNKTYGTGSTLDGKVTGRSGGVYARDYARIYNSVLWGNETNASSADGLQFFASRSKINNDYKTELHYVALSRADQTDWSSSTKYNVFELQDENNGISTSDTKYTNFKNPSTAAGHYPSENLATYHTTFDWTPKSSSAICYSGVQLKDLHNAPSIAVLSTDIVGKEYSPKCDLGAYVGEQQLIASGLSTLYVDPAGNVSDATKALGQSWDNPLDNLADALNYFKKSGKAGTIYAKEGTLFAAGRSISGTIREQSIEMVSNVQVLGGYSTSLSGTSTSSRDVLNHPTIISGYVSNNYDDNTSHLVAFKGVSNAVFDGFQLKWGNATDFKTTAGVAQDYGAGICLTGGGTGNQIKNVYVANCKAAQGAAIYANAGGSATFENCIFHNNTANVATGYGLVYVQGASTLTFNHCDFLRNVGYAIAVEASSTNSSVVVNNSIFFANMKAAYDDTKTQPYANALSAITGRAASVSGTHNVFDKQTTLVADDDEDIQNTDIRASIGTVCLGLNDTDEYVYARFVNPTKNSGVSQGNDVTTYGRATDFTPSDTNPAVNAASTGGVAHTSAVSSNCWGVDLASKNRDFGGLPDAGALENGGKTDGSATQSRYGTVVYVRDYNTYSYNADGSIASILSTDTSITHPDGAARDGSSWQNAINGNALYSTEVGVDYSNKMGKNQSDWTGATGTYANGAYVERYTEGGIATAGKVIYQTIKGLPQGTYTVKFVAVANVARKLSTSTYAGSGKAQIYANNATQDLYIGTNDVENNPGQYVKELTATVGTDGTLEYGIQTTRNNVGQWFVVQAVSLTQMSNSTTKGLQAAVDKAFAAMKPLFVTRTESGAEYHNGGSVNTTRTYYDFTPTDEHPEVSVWVGAGMYTFQQGYLIRNHVKVYGGFPKTGNPGMNERHPQLSAGIPISEANQVLGLQVKDYETILQTNTSIAERDASKTSTSVLTHPAECRVTTGDDSNVHQSRVVYEGAEWDGFTIRYGSKNGVTGGGSGRRNGGAGVSLYENVVLRNCIVRDNWLGNVTASSKGRGAGVYCDGSTIENCYLMNNKSTCSSENYGGGLYMILGTMFNTVVAGNSIPDGTGNHGNGVFFESANFYNNTIVNNTGGTSAIGVYTASAADAHLTVYNSIVMAGDKPVLWKASSSTPANFTNCYLQTQNSSLYAGSYSATLTEVVTKTNTNPANANPFVLPYNTAVTNYDYRINFKDGDYSCVNKGTEALGKDYDGKTDVVLPPNDMDYTDRVQDCRVDIGAYEYNGAASITPDTDVNRTGDANTVVYYVTELGFGTTQATDPANAACAQKLQKVLDAAGRYKFANPTKRVIVKLAGVDATKGLNEKTCFMYYPCRTTDEQNNNVRVWSIMVPRGVEVWGGYTEAANASGSEECFSENNRSVMYHPTYLQNEYESRSLNETIKGYHVVTFTDRIYDKDGHPYLKGDAVGNESPSRYQLATAYVEADFKHLSDANVTHRAVLDGLVLTGGQADGQYGDEFGGAAVVTDFAHVRNCIIKGNSATYGGGLALEKKALVSGTLVKDNEAQSGGGIYIKEDTDDNDTSASGGKYDENMPHVYTSTVVKNTATKQGGGIWFTQEMPNVRVNSTVVWKNTCSDQANVAGNTNPDLSDQEHYSTFEWFPFAYSAVESRRVSGTSNISVDMINKNGNRFGVDSPTNATTYGTFTIDVNNHIGDATKEPTIADNLNNVTFYGLTNFSALCRTGMPWEEYDALVANQGLTHVDVNKWCRDVVPTGTEERKYVDIGWRAYPSSPLTDTERPFLRLFVAQTEDVDMDAYEKIQKANIATSDANYVYKQLGSSFAYPFQSIDDALDYITSLRKSTKWKNKANNWPFEICVARGEYHPQRDMQGNYGYSLSNTFLIPEGVTLTGGFDCNDIYGQKWLPVKDREGTNVLNENVTEITNASTTVNGVEIKQQALQTMLDARALEDINMNNILEPWEFMNQTNLSGNSVNHGRGVYHTVAVAPYAPGVGQLPKVVKNNSSSETVTDYYLNCGKLTQYAWAGNPETVETLWGQDGSMVINNPSVVDPWYSLQYFMVPTNTITLVPGDTYRITFTCKAEGTKNAKIRFMLRGDWSNNYDYHEFEVPVGGNYSNISFNVSPTMAQSGLFFQHGDFVGKLYWKSITITHEESNAGGVTWVDPSDPSFDKTYWAYHSRYEGQPVVIDGVKISDGYAGNYVTNSLNDYSIYDYYYGGGLRATGNWYCDNVNGIPNHDDVYYNFNSNAVAYRDIPLYIRNCQFVNNTAGYGGALNTNVSTYIYTSYFAQNQAVRKNERITWEILEDGTKDAAGNVHIQGDRVTFDNNYPGNGGAVYVTKSLEAYNTIFANNEAKDETGLQPYGAFAALNNQNESRKIYSGAGGALVGGLRSHIMLLNCDVVRNKALVYPAVCTMNPNGANIDTESVTELGYNQIVNTLFWGNEVASSSYNYGNEFARSLVVNYGPTNNSDYYEGANYNFNLSKAPASQEALDTDSFGETMWFSAYETGRGKTPKYNSDYRDQNYTENSYIGKTIPQNNNIFLSEDNEAIDGPNLVKPSAKAGYAGYNENADWSRSRVNNLTDNGSGLIAQTDAGWGATDDALNRGVYFTKYFDQPINGHINLFDEQYMKSISGTETLPITRVAHDPLEGVSEARIDIGVYERPKISLRIQGGEVDIIWVAPNEIPENGEPNGTSWRQPTADLQRAIETLLSSHNDRRKEIRLIEGEYSPTYLIEKGDKVYQTFYINTQELQASAVLPDGAPADANYSVNSLTIKGGYSKDIPYRDSDPNSYNTDNYPAVFRMPMRQTAEGERWDRLFYIDDATKRYGTLNTVATGYGALIANSGGGNVINPETYYPSQTVTTIPIQFDGITMINNQALPGTVGSAIYYADQITTFETGNKIYTYQDNAPASVWVTDEAGTGNSHYVNGIAEVVGNYKYSVYNAPAKLVLSKCHVLNTGNASDTEAASAVYIGQYGGDALIYNSVFHSNMGNPLVAYNTRTINNTIALNKGQWKLYNQAGTVGLDEDGHGTGDGPMLAPAATNANEVEIPATSSWRKSVIQNSILWKNNPIGESNYGVQFILPGWTSDAESGAIFKYNAYTDKDGDVTVESDVDLGPKNYNSHLANENASQERGPRFEDPENNNVESRRFTLQPSLRIINKGAKSIYNNEVYDLAWINTTGFDFITEQRIFSHEIEKGAIEYQNSFDHRVYYVNPNANTDGDGLSWDNASNNLENAIQQAALYCLTNSVETDEEGNIVDPNEAYVFVQGGKVNTGLTLSSGVNVFGTVASDDEVPCDESGDTPSYYDGVNTGYDDFKASVNAIVNSRPGLMGTNTTPTTIPSISTPEGTGFDLNRPTKIDGFVISSTTPATQPVLKITPANTGEVVPAVCVSNVVVADNDASGASTNTVEIDNALIYEVLFRDNKVKDSQYVLNLGSRAYGVNLTVEGRTNDAAGRTTYTTQDNKEGSHIWYSIYNYAGQAADENTLSGYNYSLPKKNLNYQLTEKSQNIDYCPAVNPMAGNNATANLVQFINYDTDRDLLGNPRVLNTASNKAGHIGESAYKVLDRGAFETWKVGDDSNSLAVESNTNVNDYFGNYYPHDGSVVYLMENSNLISEAHTLNPGFLLVKKGASLYGHTGIVNAAYVAVEREIPANGSVVALPYVMKYKSADVNYGPARIAYAANGVLTLTADEGTTAQTYNGDSRALARYQVLDQNSGCWNTPMLSGVTTPANTGIYFNASNTVPTTYRFTAKGDNMSNYLYQEDGTVVKNVTLKTHNNEDHDGFGMHTANEDMGWNCFGIPYLVSEYAPYMQYDSNGNDFIADDGASYQMHLPKVLWLYYETPSTAAGSGYLNTVGNRAGFYPAKSWMNTPAAWHIAESETPALWVGEGMFAQTASFNDEELKFYLPKYIGEPIQRVGVVKPLVEPDYRPQSRTYVEAIEEDFNVDYNDGLIYDLQGRRVQNPQAGQIYIQNGKKFVM